MDSILRDRISYRKAARNGLAVVEMKQDKKVIQEMTKLFKEVYGGN